MLDMMDIIYIKKNLPSYIINIIFKLKKKLYKQSNPLEIFF